MKPWEEDWEVKRDNSVGNIYAIGPIEACSSERIECTLEQAKLAAQAPAMARLWLEFIQEEQFIDGPDLEYWQGEARKLLRDAGVIE